MASADSRSLAFFSHLACASLTGSPGVRHDSFTAQPLDLPSRFYVYLLGFGFTCNLTHRLALYPVSVRRLFGFATPLPPPLMLPSTACGSLHLAVATRGGSFTRKNRAMPGTHEKSRTRFVRPLGKHQPLRYGFTANRAPSETDAKSRTYNNTSPSAASCVPSPFSVR